MPTGQDIVNSARKLLGAPYRVWSSGMPVPTWLDDGEGDPPSTDYLLSTGVECSDLVCFAMEDAGIPGVHYGTEGFYDYLINTVAFDASTPAVPGAIALSPYEGASEGSQGHIAIYTSEHQLIQSLYTTGVTEDYDDATTAGWGGDTAFTLYGLLPGVDYSGTKPPAPGPLGGGTPFDVGLLMKCYSNSLDRQTAEADLPYLLAGFKEFEINTKQRIAAYLAVASGESGELEVFAEEDPPASYGIYYGRGMLGLTFDFNYQHFSDYLNDPSILSNPWQLEQAPMAIRSGCWFWRYGSVGGNLNEPADKGDFSSCMAGVYGAPDPPNADTRIAYYNWILSQLPDNVTVDGGAEEGQMSYSKYTFVVSGEPNVDIANAAATALEALGVDCLVLTEADNIAAASKAINTTNDLSKSNCIVVGKETYALLDAGAQGRSGWSSDSPIWAMYADDGKPVGTLKRVRDWALWWIYTYTGRIDKDKLLAVFDAVLQAISADYTTLLREAENQPSPPPPPLMPITLDELTAVKKADLQDGDMVVILQRKA